MAKTGALQLHAKDLIRVVIVFQRATCSTRGSNALPLPLPDQRRIDTTVSPSGNNTVRAIT
eukprot:4522934-Amphidinium_carterae.1